MRESLSSGPDSHMTPVLLDDLLSLDGVGVEVVRALSPVLRRPGPRWPLSLPLDFDAIISFSASQLAPRASLRGCLQLSPSAAP